MNNHYEPHYALHALAVKNTSDAHNNAPDTKISRLVLSDVLQIPVHVFHIVESEKRKGVATHPEIFYRRKMCHDPTCCTCCGDTPYERNAGVCFDLYCSSCGMGSLCGKCCFVRAMDSDVICMYCFLRYIPYHCAMLPAIQKRWVFNICKLHQYCKERRRLENANKRSTTTISNTTADLGG